MNRSRQKRKGRKEHKGTGHTQKVAEDICAEEILRADTLVLGAGASGLTAGITAAERSSVIIADGNDRAGRKLAVTGNGRCNFTNAYCGEEGYNGCGDGFVSSVLNAFSVEDTLEFFSEAGLMTRLEEVVGILERGDAPLEESLKLFEEGMALMRQCSTLLDRAEQRVTKLTLKDNGSAEEVPLEREE